MTWLKNWASGLYDRRTLREDAVAGLVLGVESVPDGLAGGLLAGVNPVFGLYGYMYGTLGGALFTSATFMAVFRPLPPEQCPMPEIMRAAFETRDPAVEKVLDPILLEHRDFVYGEYLELPLSL